MISAKMLLCFYYRVNFRAKIHPTKFRRDKFLHIFNAFILKLEYLLIYTSCQSLLFSRTGDGTCTIKIVTSYFLIGPSQCNNELAQCSTLFEYFQFLILFLAVLTEIALLLNCE